MRIHLAPRGLEAVLREELGSRVRFERGRLFAVDDAEPCYFAANTWLDVQELKFKSISEAARALRAVQRNWWLHSSGAAQGRAKLIVEALPPLKAKRVEFRAPVPKAPLGSWTLVDEGTMLYSASCTSAFPDGDVEFVENKTDPPSRAYLKMWEFFTLNGAVPSGRAIDVGSSPGGWTWVLDQLGCQVVSVDKAPLTGSYSERVSFRNESAFGLEPFAVDWFFSDIICYPDRLLELVRRWAPVARNMVCTIKFQGATDFGAVREFLAIPGSRVQHLHANKHELTWSRLSEIP